MIKEIEGTNLVAVYVPISADEFSMCLECQILGKVTKDKIGFDCEPYVEKYAWEDTPEGEKYAYRDYVDGTDTDDFLDTYPFDGDEIDKSFYSRLADNGIYFVNPIGESPVFLYSDYEFGEGGLSESTKESIENDFDEKYLKWQSYEDKLVKGKLLIIQKIKSK